MEGSEIMTSILGVPYQQDSDKQILYSVALLPDTKDFYGDELTVDEVEKIAHDWLHNFRMFDKEHDFVIDENLEVVESWLFKEDTVLVAGDKERIYPKGTWAIGVKVTSSELWQEVLDGNIQGLSITAFKDTDRQLVEGSFKSVEEFEEWDVLTLDDLKADGSELFVPVVSFVRDPAFMDARIFALKSLPKVVKSTKAELVRQFIKEKMVAKMKEEDITMNKKELEKFLDTYFENKMKAPTASKKSRFSKKAEGEEEIIDEEAKVTLLEEVATKAGVDVAEVLAEVASQDGSSVIEVLDEAVTKAGLDLEEVLTELASEKEVDIEELISELEATEEVEVAEKAEDTVALDEMKAEYEATIAELTEKVASLEKSVKGKSTKLNASTKSTEVVIESKFKRDAFGRRIK
jgi:hypothetical protein